MIACKVELFSDQGIRGQSLKCSAPKKIKTLGCKVGALTRRCDIRFKYSVVLNGNWCEFSQKRSPREFLPSIGHSVLVEANPYNKSEAFAYRPVHRRPGARRSVGDKTF